MPTNNVPEDDIAVQRYRAEQDAKSLKAGATLPDDSIAEDYWSKEIKKQGRDGWYNRALEYWDAQDATVNGVLGGYGHTTGQDLRESGRLLKLLRGRKDVKFSFDSCLDCGSGVGRISEGLLLNEFENVDIMEPCGKLIVEARRRLARGKGCVIPSLSKGRPNFGVRNLYPYSLQDFAFCSEKNRTLGETETAKEVDDTLRNWQAEQHKLRVAAEKAAREEESGIRSPTEEPAGSSTSASSKEAAPQSVAESVAISNSQLKKSAEIARAELLQKVDVEPISPLKYDCIWNQWVLLYLTDRDLISYLRRCRNALTENGFIFCKENVMPPPRTAAEKESHRYKRGFEVDVEDNGLTRTDDRYRMLFYKAGMEIVCAMKQANWPEGLYPVYMYVLKPAEGVNAAAEKFGREEA